MSPLETFHQLNLEHILISFSKFEPSYQNENMQVMEFWSEVRVLLETTALSLFSLPS